MPMTVTAPGVTPVPLVYVVSQPPARSGSRACTMYGHVNAPSVLTSTQRYSVCAESASKTPLWVAVGENELDGFS